MPALQLDTMMGLDEGCVQENIQMMEGRAHWQTQRDAILVRVNAFRPTRLLAFVCAGRMRAWGYKPGTLAPDDICRPEEEHEQMKGTGPEQGGKHDKQG